MSTSYYSYFLLRSPAAAAATGGYFWKTAPRRFASSSSFSKNYNSTTTKARINTTDDYRSKEFLSPPSSSSSASSTPSSPFRFLLSSSATDVEKFGEFLDSLRSRSSIRSWAKSGGGEGGGGAIYKSVLYTAPYLAGDLYQQRYAEEFTELVDEWFYQIRPIIAQDTRRGELTGALQFNPNAKYGGGSRNPIWKSSSAPLFNIAYQLQYLGYLNRSTNGRLARRLGRRNVNYLARRMVECGFYTYTFSEVTYAALKGLCDLLYDDDEIDDAQQSILDEEDQQSHHHYTAGLKLWLTALAHYISGAESKPSEWEYLTCTNARGGGNRSSITAVLSRLHVLEKRILAAADDQQQGSDSSDSSEIAVIFGYLKQTLCHFAKTHFDTITDSCRADHEAGRISPRIRITRTSQFLNEYANHWLRYEPELGDEKNARQEDPEDYARGTWRSWYEACGTILRQLSITESLVRRRPPDHHQGQGHQQVQEEEENYENHILSINRANLTSPMTLKLLRNAVEAACIFDNQTGPFYQTLFNAASANSEQQQQWRAAINRFFAGKTTITNNNKSGQQQQQVSFTELLREVSHITSFLIKLALIDSSSSSTKPIAAEEQEGDQEEQEEGVVSWKKHHEDSVELAMVFLRRLCQDKTDISYRAMSEIIGALADLREYSQQQQAETERGGNLGGGGGGGTTIYHRRVEKTVMNQLLVYLRDWTVDKRKKNLAYNAAEAAQAIKTALNRLGFSTTTPPPPNADSSKLIIELVFSELDKLYAIGRK